MEHSITIGSLFDGIGGFPYAASFFGVQPLWASEIIPECISITKARIPQMAHLGDVTKIDGRSIPAVDIITFGSPCQGLSIAGRRLGMADERSGLFSEAIRIINEMREVTHGRKPEFAIWENVPGALSSAAGFDFKAVLEAFTKAEIPMPNSGRWARAGLVRGGGVDLSWCVYDAQYFGTAQRRKRIFLVADFRGKRSGQILFVPKSLRGYFEAGGTPRQGAAAYFENNLGKTVQVLNDQGGSSISVEKRAISPTIRCETHGHLPIVSSVPMPELGCQAWGFDLQQITSKLNHTTLKPVQPTLCAASSPHVVAYPKITGTLCASGAGLSRTAGMANETDLCIIPPHSDLSSHVRFARRLTPRECERLQGYPDDWTARGVDGKAISDTKRYQMLGNSIAVPCVAYIMQGITDSMRKEASDGVCACPEGSEPG